MVVVGEGCVCLCRHGFRVRADEGGLCVLLGHGGSRRLLVLGLGVS